ncbi:MAG: RnfABCDGE type electron transport complex subunit G [Prevotella sp.]|uniref:RnfABCDGE type electron transport complex subunit G n=1 Tax=Prevotella sp. TaxID=59823 RepID=UPI002A2A949B|nr:RnfABCDGE type electron transport complex subunit G [Prevotella sp.]MDD7318847.1 RnfABCDGE type electron transport complex subunit G [Prevotellaceae bacterium]MDY4019224.1 RnfABCDGE type electron transport complex subunit G [Prevotella sp.]
MEKLKSSITNMVLVLTGIAVITGSILAVVNNVTEEPIALQKEKTLAEGIKTVMGGGELVVAKTDTVTQTDDKGKTLTYVIYSAQDSNHKDIGAAVESTTGAFGGDLKILVGFDLDGNILGYTLLEHAETPGLGAKADKWFQKGGKGCIIGKNPETNVLLVTKDTRKTDNKQGEIDAITASTITSRAFLHAVNSAYDAYKTTNVDAHSGASKQSKSEHKKELKK